MKHPCPLHLYSVPHENPQHLSLALILCSRKNGKILLTSECCYCDDVYELSDFTKPRIEDRPVLYCHPLSIYLDISIYLPVSDVAGERQTQPASSLPLPLHSAGREETESTVGSQPPRHPQH